MGRANYKNYDKLRNARMSNTKLKTTNIKGKEYVQVNERIRAFRSMSQYKGYKLVTKILKLDESECFIEAQILNDDDKIVANGHAHEIKTASYINKTSYIENCETSAWGRALGNLGIGVDTSIATAEEIESAIETQKSLKKTTAKKELKKPKQNTALQQKRQSLKQAVSDKINRDGVDKDFILKKLDIKNSKGIDSFTEKDCDEAFAFLETL